MDTKGQCVHAVVTRNSCQWSVVGRQFTLHFRQLATDHWPLLFHTNEKLSPK
jgi:hypothetical protein